MDELDIESKGLDSAEAGGSHGEFDELVRDIMTLEESLRRVLGGFRLAVEGLGLGGIGLQHTRELGDDVVEDERVCVLVLDKGSE